MNETPISKSRKEGLVRNGSASELIAVTRRSGFADLPPSISDLDPEVLAAMPEEYQREVLGFYGETGE